jgi:hypothetical protein
MARRGARGKKSAGEHETDNAADAHIVDHLVVHDVDLPAHVSRLYPRLMVSASEGEVGWVSRRRGPRLVESAHEVLGDRPGTSGSAVSVGSRWPRSAPTGKSTSSSSGSRMPTAAASAATSTAASPGPAATATAPTSSKSGWKSGEGRFSKYCGRAPRKPRDLTHQGLPALASTILRQSPERCPEVLL